MIGLVLWHNPDVGSGVIWCEDQGALAFLGPDAALPGGPRELVCGDQVTFSFELREGVRFVRDVYLIERGNGVDPREVLAGFHETREKEGRFNSVA